MTSLLHLSGWRRCLLLMLAGGLSVLALAPFFYVPLLWLTIPLLIHYGRQANNAKTAFWLGWWFGFGYFPAGIYWFAHALLVDAAAFGWMIPFAVFGIGGILAIYSGLTLWLTHKMRPKDTLHYSLCLALCWTVMEILRSLLFSGFPWNLIGYSWAASDISIQIASLGGIWWLSLLTILFASMPLWFHNHKKAMVAGIGMFALLLIYGGWRLYTHPTEYNQEIKLRLVQPAIPQELKWQPEQRLAAIRKQMEMSLQPGYDTVTHIIWAESAMTYRFEEGDFWTQELARVAPEKGSLITGVIRDVAPLPPTTVPTLYNSLKSVTREGQIDAYYDKRKLVPFGEFVPFRNYLPLKRITHGSIDFSTGDSDKPVSVKGLPPFIPLICYEVIFPWLSDHAYPHWLLTITNDGWFGLSTGPHQHFHMARMRAVEQGVPMVRAANSGISAFIDSYGRVLSSLPLGGEGILDGHLPQIAPSPTLYHRLGYMPLIGTMAGLAILILFRHKHHD